MKWLHTGEEDRAEAEACMDAVLDTRYFSSKSAQGPGWSV